MDTHRAYTSPSTVPTRYNITSLITGTKAPINMLSKGSGVCHYKRKLKILNKPILKKTTAERIAVDSSMYKSIKNQWILSAFKICCDAGV